MQNILSIIRQYKIADEICANEYENCSAQIRGLLKTAIAFHFSASVYPKNCEQFTEHSSSGFCQGYKKQNISALLFLVDKKYDSPAKFLSLLCRSIRANVQQCFVFIDKNMPEETFRLFINCLELCGIENSYYLPDKAVLNDFYAKMQKIAGTQVKLINCNENNQDFIALKQKDIFTENLPLEIIAQKSQKKILELAYGKSAAVTYQTQNPPQTARKHFQNILEHCLEHGKDNYDISFISTKTAEQNYGMGMEFCFTHPQLPQNFFNDTVIFSNLESNYPISE